MSWRGVVLCLFFLSRVDAAIIGRDDRSEWFETKKDSLRELGLSTAALLDRRQNFLEKKDDNGQVHYQFTSHVVSHAQYDDLCPDERFGSQPSPAFCTAFLVGDDLAMTAGHCLTVGCSNIDLLFDFHLLKSDQSSFAFGAESLYSCSEVIASDKAADWALIRLDRKVEGRTPFRPRKIGEPELGTQLAVMGFPRGIPLKIADNAQVVPSENSDDTRFFEADLDVFGGNSGSPVVNSTTLQLEGILSVAFGELDESVDAKTGIKCNRMRTFSDPKEATPTWVVRASTFAKAIR